MLLRIIIYYIKLIFFKRKWRKINTHNLTAVKNIFPISKVNAGKYTYGTLEVYTWDAPNEKLKIGSYVSIAQDVKFILGGNHKFCTPFSYPFKTKILNLGEEAVSKGPIIIEDDVWIGMNVIILSGAKIGRGAVIAAGSVISRDVPPYAVVGGSPAKVIKFRFSEEKINYLMNIDFSKLDKDYIERNIDLLYKDFERGTLDDLLLKDKNGRNED